MTSIYCISGSENNLKQWNEKQQNYLIKQIMVKVLEILEPRFWSTNSKSQPSHLPLQKLSLSIFKMGIRRVLLYKADMKKHLESTWHRSCLLNCIYNIIVITTTNTSIIDFNHNHHYPKPSIWLWGPPRSLKFLHWEYLQLNQVFFSEHAISLTVILSMIQTAISTPHISDTPSNSPEPSSCLRMTVMRNARHHGDLLSQGPKLFYLTKTARLLCTTKH